MVKLSSLEHQLGLEFRDPSLLRQALTHSSYLNENEGSAAESNERLEFLGDSVIGLIIAEILFKRFPESNEGILTQFRSALVRRETLARLGKGLELGNYLLLGKGEESGGGRAKPANLASAFEALVGAVYLDQGLTKVSYLISNLFKGELTSQKLYSSKTDHKSQLQEFVQARGQDKLTYEVLASKGPAHDKVFTVQVSAGKNILGRGSGKSKKASEMEAAKSALERLQDQKGPGGKNRRDL